MRARGTSASAGIGAGTHDDAALVEAAELRRLEADMRYAVSRERFALHYQPRWSLLDGEAVGAEALVRWPHRRRGLIAPSTFIPYLERSGLVVRLGGWVLRTACAEAASWPPPERLPAGAHRPAPSVSVNISARQIAEGTLIAQVTEALEASGLAPELLELELTETTLLHVDESVLLTIAALRDAGVGLALDDFGSGYASLGMIRKLQFSAVKLDRTLVHRLPDDPEDSTLVRTIVEASHAMGMTVVAEGVETAAQHDFLVAIGCDEAQGYLLGRAMPARDLPFAPAHGMRSRAAGQSEGDEALTAA